MALQMIKINGIVLGSNPSNKDASRNLELFSVEKGKLFATARGVEKPKAKLAVACQPFCFGEYMLAETNGRYVVADCSVNETFYQLVSNLDNYVIGSGLLQVVSKIVPSGEQNAQLFMLLLNSLKLMAYDNVNALLVGLKFIIDSLKNSGFGFGLKNCSKCGKDLSQEKKVSLVYDGDGAVCYACSLKTDCVNLLAEEWELLKKIEVSNLDSLANVNFKFNHLNELFKLVLKQFFFRTGEKITALDGYFSN